MIVDPKFIEFAKHLADIAGEISCKYFRQNFNSNTKNDNSPVTIADKEIEKTLIKKIKHNFPDHGIIGEEFGSINPNSPYQWVIDPIDGTKSFVIGAPIFGNLISLCFEKEPIIGIINQPINNERWVGIVGEKTTFNGKEISTRKCLEISEANFACTSPAYFTGKNAKILQEIQKKTKFQNNPIYGGDCYLFGLLASGFIDIILETGLKNYDMMALVPIIKGSGGWISDWRGEDINLDSNGNILACGDKRIYKKLDLYKNYINQQ